MQEKHNTDWFKDAKWGVMLHYLSRAPGAKPGTDPGDDFGAKQWNERINNFNCVALSEQLAEIGAGYLLISVGQNCGYYLAPNAAYDSVVGEIPSKCSERDLISDLFDVLNPNGIKLMTYLPCHPPAKNIPVLEKFKCTPNWKDREVQWCGLKKTDYKIAEDVDERLSCCQMLWNNVIREWSERWGNKVVGWWIDGGHNADLMYDHDDEPNFQSLSNALKAGNPESIIALASGRIDSFKYAPIDDYTAGEMGGYLRVHQIKRWKDGIQYHTLNTLGHGWGESPTRYTNGDFVAAFTREINEKEGVVTWDTPPAMDGTIPDEFMKQLKQIDAF